MLSTFVYDAFGSRMSGTSAGEPWGYGAAAGYFTDNETGLLYLSARYYDSGAGRFVTRDPIGCAGGVNLYGYVGNGPVNAVDPSGLLAPTGLVNSPDGAVVEGWSPPGWRPPGSPLPGGVTPGQAVIIVAGVEAGVEILRYNPDDPCATTGPFTYIGGLVGNATFGACGGSNTDPDYHPYQPPDGDPNPDKVLPCQPTREEWCLDEYMKRLIFCDFWYSGPGDEATRADCEQSALAQYSLCLASESPLPGYPMVVPNLPNSN